jgi:hypothetical protein
MTTFEEMKNIMEANGWETLSPQDYQMEKRKKKQNTARIGSMLFKLKEEKRIDCQNCKLVNHLRERCNALELHRDFWEKKYENAVKIFADAINKLGEKS